MTGKSKISCISAIGATLAVPGIPAAAIFCLWGLGHIVEAIFPQSVHNHANILEYMALGILGCVALFGLCIVCLFIWWAWVECYTKCEEWRQ